jgi:aldose 1-epimerase
MAPIPLRSDALEVAVLPLGAALVGLRFAGEPRNMVLGFADPADHSRLPVYAGAIVGPVANRIRAGLVEIDGMRHTMALNENGVTTLHSGPEGLHGRVWQVIAQTGDSLTLTCTLADGACGLPGVRQFTACYAVTGADLTLTLTGATDRPTAMNLAPHVYWNLDGGGDVTGHTLQVHATHYLPTDARSLPTGEIAPLAGTAFDFTKCRPVPADPALDVYFCLSSTPAARLRGSDGTTLEITTDAPGLQVYNGASLPTGTAVWADGPPLGPYAALALEPQCWPDAPHHRHFPQIRTTPDSPFRQVTTFRLRPP